MGLLLVAGFASTLGSVCAGENWPEFRGPDGTGIVPDVQLRPVTEWEENIQWSTPIPGRGWSSPVVWDDQVWLTTATE
ncbi:MAG: PQQ-binding-like beta-propeller repeat protein, partial [Planctomycetales bacterium]|nr:PQQ-binding-like beta-propeller repeat protein [Planctomycetales bacterium]